MKTTVQNLERGRFVISQIVPIEIATPFPEGSVNAYLLLGDPVTLVDTGIWQPESPAQVREALSQLGLDLRDIRQIVVTHMHMDHAGGVPALQNDLDVPVFVHEHAQYTLTGGAAEFERIERHFRSFFRMCGAEGQVTRTAKFRELNWKNVHYLQDGDALRAGGRTFDVVYVPGHSQTDICLWDAESGDALVGDHLLKDISANAFLEPPSPHERTRPKALLQYRSSMTRTQQLPFQTIYPGHGQPYVGHTELIAQRFSEHEDRCKEILEHLCKGKSTVYELSTAMFPWLKGNAVFLGLSEVLGHLDLLEDQSRVVMEMEHDVSVFRPA